MNSRGIKYDLYNSNEAQFNNWLVSNGDIIDPSNFFALIEPPINGHMIYYFDNRHLPSIFSCNSDTELINMISSLSGSVMTDMSDIIQYSIENPKVLILSDKNSEIFKEGLIFYLSASNKISYPRIGTIGKNEINYDIQRNHSRSEWICLANTTLIFSTIESDTNIYEIDASGQTNLLNTINTPTVYTTTGEIGSIYYSNKPMSIFSNNNHHAIAPFSISGKYFGVRAVRVNYSIFKFYAPYASATIKIYLDNGIDAEPYETIYIPYRTVIEYQLTRPTPAVIIIESDENIIVTKVEDTGSDSCIIAPMSTKLLKVADFNDTVFDTYNNTPLSLIGEYYVENDELVACINSSDGSGNDTTTHIPYDMVSNTYLYSTALSDFTVVSEKSNNIRVKYWNGSAWTLSETIVLNVSDKPVGTYRDGTTGFGVTGSVYGGNANNFESGADKWLFEGDSPFALFINDINNAASFVLGYMNTNQNKVILINGVEHSTEPNRFIIDGTDDNIIGDLDIDTNQPHTFEVIYQTNIDYTDIDDRHTIFALTSIESILGYANLSFEIWGDSFVIFTGNGSQFAKDGDISIPISIRDANYHLMTIILDRNEITAYIDNIKIGSIVPTYTNICNKILLGNRAGSNNVLNGAILEARVYNRILSLNEREESYTNFTDLIKKPIIDFDFSVDNVYRNGVINNLSKGENGQLINGPTYKGNFNGVLSFDGTNDIAQIDYNNTDLDGSPVFSVEAVIIRTDNVSGGGYWGIGRNFTRYNINSYMLTQNKIGIDLWGTTTYHTGVDYPLNEEVHIIWTFRGTTFERNNVSIFINGKEYTGNDLIINRENIVTPTLEVLNWGISFGTISQFNTNYAAPGDFSLFRVYKHELVQQDVDRLYQEYKSRNYSILKIDASDKKSYPVVTDNIFDMNDRTPSLLLPTLHNSRRTDISIGLNQTPIDFNLPKVSDKVVTIDIWVKIQNRDSMRGEMIMGWLKYDLYISPDRELGFNTAAGDTFGLNEVLLNDINFYGRFVNITLVMNNGTYVNNKIYIDGEYYKLDKVRVSNILTPNANFNNGLGRINGWLNDNNYSGIMEIGKFEIFNKELSDSEIKSLYNLNRSKYNIVENGLKVYYDFSQQRVTFPNLADPSKLLTLGGGTHDDINGQVLYNPGDVESTYKTPGLGSKITFQIMFNPDSTTEGNLYFNTVKQLYVQCINNTIKTYWGGIGYLTSDVFTSSGVIRMATVVWNTDLGYVDFYENDTFLNRVEFTPSPKSVNDNTDVVFGRQSSGFRVYDGTIQSHIMYDRELSIDEIKHNYTVLRGRYNRFLDSPKTYFFDKFGIAGGAFSFRDLSGTDPIVVRVRRSLDGTFQDFRVSQLTNGDLLDFVGRTASDQGTIMTWYNQGTQGNFTATAQTEEPYIVVNGVLSTRNGHVSIFYKSDGIGNNLVSTALTGSVQTVFRVLDPTSNGHIIPSTSTGGSNYGFVALINDTANNSYSNYGTPDLIVNGKLENVQTRDEILNVLGGFKLSTIVNESTTTWTGIQIGHYSGGSNIYDLDGYVTEYIGYVGGVTNREEIEADINSYYNLYKNQDVINSNSDAKLALSLRDINNTDPIVLDIVRSLDETSKKFRVSEIKNIENWVNSGSMDINAAIIFGLRYINSNYKGQVVEVRRDIDNNLRSFYPDEILNGDLVKWATRYNDLLPADYNSISTALSLRNIKTDYNGYVVQIRKNTNDYKNFRAIDFFNNNIIEWLNGTNGYVSIIYDQSEKILGIEIATATPTTDNDGTVSQADEQTTYTITNVVTRQGPYITNILTSGKTYRVMFEAKSDDFTGIINSVGDLDVAYYAVSSPELSSSWNKYEFIINVTQSTLRLYFELSGHSIGDTMIYRNISCKEVISGYNNAHQIVNNAQPMIASNGSLILDNGLPTISFNGTTNYMDLVKSITSDELLVYTTLNVASTTNGSIFGNNDTNFIKISGNTISYDNNTSTNSSTYNWDLNNTELLTLRIQNGVYTSSQNSITDQNANLNGTQTIKHIGRSGALGAYFNGNIQEIIILNNDLLANENEIEVNINNYYNIFNKPNATVRRLYNQGWYDSNALQDNNTLQPYIVENGILVSYKGKPSIRFQPEVTSALYFDADILIGTKYSIFASAVRTSENTKEFLGGDSINGIADINRNLHIGWQLNSIMKFDQYYNGTTIAVGAFSEVKRSLITAINRNSGKYIKTDNVEAIWNTNTDDMLSLVGAKIGGRGSTVRFDGLFDEIIIFDNDQSSNALKIESNINNYYRALSSDNMGYVKTWYGQDNSKNNATQVDINLMPVIVENGELCKERGLPAIKFPRTTDHLVFNTISSVDNNLCGYVVYRTDMNGTFAIKGNGSEFGRRGNGQIRLYDNTSGSTNGGTHNDITTLISFINNGTSSILYQNGTAVVSLSSFDTQFNTVSSSIESITGGIQEILLYTSDQIGYNEKISQNLLNYYNITV